MGRETYAERKTREATRDGIRDTAWGVAEHVAGANMVTVTRDECGKVQFSRPIEAWRCECGLPMAPFPEFSSRYGELPIWMCGVCNLEDVVRMCAAAVERAGEASA